MDRFAHEHFNMLVNIEKSLVPVMRTLPGIGDATDTRRYYFEKLSDTIGMLMRLGRDLYSRIETAPELETFRIRLQSLLDPLQTYLLSEEKFNPAFLSDKLLELEEFMADLSGWSIYSQDLHFITLEMDKANLILNEFFLRQAYELILYARNSADEILTRIDNEAADVQYRTLNIIEIIEDHISNERASSDSKRIEIRREYDNKNCYALGFKWDITRALGNIINNAIKYNDTLDKYKVWITIKVGRDGDWLVVEVENWGPGIDSDEMREERIFEKGYRGRQAERRNIPGTGIGLYDARKGIERSGGYIELTSERVPRNNQYITRVIISLRAIPVDGL